MIELTRFDGSQFYVNAELIEFIETTPDTVISLIDHKKLLVRETAAEVVRRVLDYRMRAGAIPPALATAFLRWFAMPHGERPAGDREAPTSEEDPR
jgi:flagellar protein FlbD